MPALHSSARGTTEDSVSRPALRDGPGLPRQSFFRSRTGSACRWCAVFGGSPKISSPKLFRAKIGQRM